MRILVIIILLSHIVFAQNERNIRKMYSGDLFEKKTGLIPSVRVETHDYMFDLTNDGESERLKVVKTGFEDNFQIYTNLGKKVFEFPLKAMGKNSSIYKLRVRKISKKYKVIVIYYFEGIIDSTKYQSQTKVYFLTIEKNDLKKIYASQGSYIEHEKGILDITYYKKSLELEFKDFDLDGTDEIIIGQKSLQRVFRYGGKGLWSQI